MKSLSILFGTQDGKLSRHTRLSYNANGKAVSTKRITPRQARHLYTSLIVNYIHLDTYREMWDGQDVVITFDLFGKRHTFSIDRINVNAYIVYVDVKNIH